MIQPGERFGRLVVVRESHRDNGVHWLCACDCGATRTARAGHLKAGLKSCGCAQRDAGRVQAVRNKEGGINRTHGLSHGPLHHAYDNMLKRCYRPGARRYERYGGRGIGVCQEWRGDRLAFYAWAQAHGWAEGLSLDRIDVDGDYSPDNCRWATAIEQANNTSRNRHITWAGETRTVAEWERVLDVPRAALAKRLFRGWSVERSMTQRFRRPMKRKAAP